MNVRTKRLVAPSVVLLTSLALFILPFFGVPLMSPWMKLLFSCEQEPWAVIPCFSVYNLLAMVAVSLVGVVSLIALVYRLVKRR